LYIEEATLDDILRQVFEALLKSGNIVDASRGKNRELIGVLLRLTNPRARLSHTDKKGKIFSALGELIWYLSKSDDVEQIAYYLRDYRKDDDNGRIYGAYGPRIFAMRGQDQFANVVSLLRNRDNSRKAVIQLLNAEDVSSGKPEIPCTCDFQFMIRSGKLHMVAHMRSNDAYMGLPHDVFAFTMIQEIMACKLGVGLGEYTHLVGSLHLYEDKEEDARQYAREGWQSTVGAAMPPMPAGDQQATIDALVDIEAKIREGKTVDINNKIFHDFWADLIRLLQIFQYKKDKNYDAVSSLRRQMAASVYDEYILKAVNG
jgi:thymidylate synthase